MDLQGAYEGHSTFGKHANESACVYTKNITLHHTMQNFFVNSVQRYLFEDIPTQI